MPMTVIVDFDSEGGPLVNRALFIVFVKVSVFLDGQ